MERKEKKWEIEPDINNNYRDQIIEKHTHTHTVCIHKWTLTWLSNALHEKYSWMKNKNDDHDDDGSIPSIHPSIHVES